MRKIKEAEKQFVVAISKSPNLRTKLKNMVLAFDDLVYCWSSARFSDFKKAGLEKPDFEELMALRKIVFPDKEQELLERENIRAIFFGESKYPKLLKEISSPPIILFVRGNLEAKENTLAIVGTRRPTNYGIDVALNIAEKLARAGVVIVSGLAIGIDALAHRGALNLGQRTIAVLGSGIDNNSIYPSSNRSLALKILENNGAVVSEYPPGFPIFKGNFPERNRIISGLSHGVIIVEAKIKSGALITANFALGQNREVFAVPGDIKRKESEGPNNLIKLGAKAVTSHVDVLEEFGIESSNDFVIASTPEEAKILEALENGPLHVDAIAQKAQLTIQETSSTLSLMEIKGKVMNLGALNFSVKK